jgi:hypothetical protein
MIVDLESMVNLWIYLSQLKTKVIRYFVLNSKGYLTIPFS